MDYNIEIEDQVLVLEIQEPKESEPDRFMEIVKWLKKELNQ